jgi:hypothetical protein
MVIPARYVPKGSCTDLSPLRSVAPLHLRLTSAGAPDCDPGLVPDLQMTPRLAGRPVPPMQEAKTVICSGKCASGLKKRSTKHGVS